MRYTLIIPAAGQGKRMGAGQNKLFLPIASIPLIIHTLRVFEEDEACERIILAINADEQPIFKDFIKRYGIKKKIVFAAGGQERQDSVYNGLMQAGEASYILVHDGARPFITIEIIKHVLEEAVRKGASICAVPVKDTIKRVEDGGVVETVERSQLWSVQTPQGFHFSTLSEAHEEARKAGYVGTDDASLVERLGKEVGVVSGSYFNIKVTTPDDLIVAESFLARG